ncbi:MAG: response regulator [gamma proteobacterium endosymbiont of Lamellibrachia anaximandri]|nr:response regulator [gamma proteobacterium endosymbiont of Lamellibrachia anaximandri]MBL3535137.1 response regulator [gamma proteobacterium endosymbiont of Lamellibrachia anaximandri]
MQRILIVDDQGVTRVILEEFLHTLAPEAQVEVFASSLHALAWAGKHSLVLAIVDYNMPGMDGIELTRQLRALPGNEGLPVAMITAVDDADHTIRCQALEAGVLDFLYKPIEPNEWRARFRNLLALGNRKCRDSRKMSDILFRIAHTIFGRNPRRVAGISRCIADQLGLASGECELIEQAAPLNDLGQVQLPDQLLSRQSRLHQADREAMQQHTLLGYQLLPDSESEFLEKAARIALSHHERFDGRGYPHGFGGGDIPLEARIVTVADVVDALLSDRPYRSAWRPEQMLTFLQAERGKRFDPDCIDAFFQRQEEILVLDSTDPVI